MRAWWVQRASAAYILLFLLFVLVSFASHSIQGYSEWKASLAQPTTTLALLAFVAGLIAHVWVGLRDVLLDYARPTGLRNGLLVTVAFALLGIGAWMLWILARLHT